MRSILLVPLALAAAVVACGGHPGDGGNPRPDVGDISFAYSPGGDSLLVSFATDTSYDDLYVVSLSGYERTALGVPGAFPSWRAGAPGVLVTVGTSTDLVDLSGPSITPLSIPGDAVFASWHPSVPLLVVTTNNANNGNPPDLWLADSTGGSLRRIPLSGPPRNQTNAASWSPDGHHLVASEVGRLLVFDTTGTDTAYITPSGMDAEFPQWSPNGQWIVFQRVTNVGATGDDLYLVHPDGTGRHLLVPDGRFPRWRPDGQRLGFVRVHQGVVAVWSVDTLGHGLRQETFPPFTW